MIYGPLLELLALWGLAFVLLVVLALNKGRRQ